jgi:hypothetical protein
MQETYCLSAFDELPSRDDKEMRRSFVQMVNEPISSSRRRFSLLETNGRHNVLLCLYKRVFMHLTSVNERCIVTHCNYITPDARYMKHT